MKCPLCGGKLDVENSRFSYGKVKRRRICTECLTEFHTTEKINYEKLPPYILNKLHERMRDNG